MHVSSKLFSITLSLGLLLIPSDAASPGTKKFVVGGHQPAAFKAPSPDVASPNVLSLTRKSGSLSAAYLASIRKGNQVNGIYGFTPLTSVEQGQVFLAGIMFGSESFQAVVDTGSSDTWLAETGFHCFDVATGNPEPESYCAFGPTYNISSTFNEIPNENFNISYADGEVLTGIVGTERVTLAGIEVKNQQVAVVDYAAWFGDGISSGLVGLSFPILTSAYTGSNPTLDSKATQVVYNPIFTNMYSEGRVAPLFSLAIDRGTSGGVMAIGGLPPVLFSPFFASAPFQLLTMTRFGSTNPIDGIPQYQFYTITVDGFSYQGSERTQWTHGNWPNSLAKPSDPSKVQLIVDSGTTLIYLPTGIANAVNALFVPPAVYDPKQGAYVVQCFARAPKFGVIIGKQIFYINALDMVLPSGNGTCISGVDDAGTGGLSILGDVFLKNVLAVFDVGASEMRFAAREFY
jgi:hypothetical protein